MLFFMGLQMTASVGVFIFFKIAQELHTSEGHIKFVPGKKSKRNPQTFDNFCDVCRHLMLEQKFHKRCSVELPGLKYFHNSWDAQIMFYALGYENMGSDTIGT